MQAQSIYPLRPPLLYTGQILFCLFLHWLSRQTCKLVLLIFYLLLVLQAYFGLERIILFFLQALFSFSFLSFFFSFLFFFHHMPITLSILASCNLFRSNKFFSFLASLAFRQAHSIYPIMASFYSFRSRLLLIYRPIVGLESLIFLFYSPIKLTSLDRLGLCGNKETLPVGTVLRVEN